MVRSKLSSELVSKAVDNILAYAAGKEYTVGDKTIKGKKRNFVETVELQIGTCPPPLPAIAHSSCVSWRASRCFMLIISIVSLFMSVAVIPVMYEKYFLGNRLFFARSLPSSLDCLAKGALVHSLFLLICMCTRCTHARTLWIREGAVEGCLPSCLLPPRDSTQAIVLHLRLLST